MFIAAEFPLAITLRRSETLDRRAPPGLIKSIENARSYKHSAPLELKTRPKTKDQRPKTKP